MKVKRLKLKPWVKYGLLILLVIIFSISSFQIGKYLIETYKTNTMIDNIIENVNITEIDEGENSELINPDEDKKSDYWTFISSSYIDVNFDELLKRNKDTVAWIYLNNTNINYPVVQSNNNTYYLTHAFDKTWNSAGWLFMDYRNNSNNFGANTIIYGHSMLNSTMFGTLYKTRKASWYTNKDNLVIKLSTPSYYTLWQIVSLYKVEAESYYIKTEFADNKEIDEFHETILNRSIYNFNTSLITTDSILTLSTCTGNDNDRYVVHSKLIKKEAY